MKKRILLPSLTLVCVLGLTGCGVIKDRADRVVVAAENSQGTRQSTGRPGERDEEDEALRQIRQFLNLYTDHGTVSREGLANFIAKYKEKIAPFLEGMSLSAQELIDLLFKFDANHDLRLTPQELSDGLMKRIPILRWIPDNHASITREELDEQIAREYPNSGPSARKGLGEALMLSDSAWSEGNQDGRISRAEVSGAGLVIGVVAQTDFSQGFTIPPGAIGEGGGLDLNPVIGNLVRQKLDQQLFSRYPDPRAQSISEDDRRLEWMQLALKFFAIDKLVHHFGQRDGSIQAGKLPEAAAGKALSAWGIEQLPHWSSLRKIYGSGMMGGEADNAYSSLEAFNLITDLEYARKVRSMTRGQFSSKALNAHPNKRYLLDALTRLLPRTGAGLYLAEYQNGSPLAGAPRSEYWDDVSWQFDDSFRGGNEDKSLDEGEVAMMLAYAKLDENLFELFDTDHNSYLERPEGNKLFETFGLTDYRIIDAFYANVGLNSNAPGFWARLKVFFGGDRGWRRLSPFSFHVRIAQVLPRLLDKEEGDLP